MTPTPPDLALAQQVVKECTHSYTYRDPDPWASKRDEPGACAPCLAQALGRVRREQREQDAKVAESMLRMATPGNEYMGMDQGQVHNTVIHKVSDAIRHQPQDDAHG